MWYQIWQVGPSCDFDTKPTNSILIIPQTICLSFNCRSLYSPSSVHQLRPGDIDIIGGLGDSLVAGSGALEEYAVGTFIEARGVSWCVGGQGSWRKYLTLPNLIKVCTNARVFIHRKNLYVTTNERLVTSYSPSCITHLCSYIIFLFILIRSKSVWMYKLVLISYRCFFIIFPLTKEFNPKLTGYSTGTGEFISSKARLNIAFPVAATEDALHQARILVHRIKNDPNINVKKQWKVIAILFISIDYK